MAQSSHASTPDCDVVERQFANLCRRIAGDEDFSKQKLHLQDFAYKDTHILQLVKALETNTKIRHIYLQNCNGITDTAAFALAEAYTRHPALQRLDMGHCAVGDAGLLAIGKALNANPRFHYLHIERNNSTPQGRLAFSDLLFSRHNRHVSTAIIGSVIATERELPLLRHVTRQNRICLQTVSTLIRKKNQPAEWSPEEMRRIAPHLQNALFDASDLSDMGRENLIARYKAFLGRLPTLPEKTDSLAKALFMQDRPAGFAPLDNPSLWDSPIAAETTLNQLDWNDQSLRTNLTERGTSLYEAAYNALGPERFLSFMHRRNISIRAADLLGEDGRPNALFISFIRDHAGHRLLGPANSAGWQNAEYLRLRHFLPDYQKERTPGFLSTAPHGPATPRSR